MVDFELVGVLPLSFAGYTLHSGKNTFAREVAKYLDWLPTSENLQNYVVQGNRCPACDGWGREDAARA